VFTTIVKTQFNDSYKNNINENDVNIGNVEIDK